MAVQKCSKLETELETVHAREADLQKHLAWQLNEYKNMEDRCLKVRTPLVWFVEL